MGRVRHGLDASENHLVFIVSQYEYKSLSL